MTNSGVGSVLSAQASYHPISADSSTPTNTEEENFFTKPIVIAIAGGVLLLIIIIIICVCVAKSKKNKMPVNEGDGRGSANFFMPNYLSKDGGSSGKGFKYGNDF